MGRNRRRHRRPFEHFADSRPLTDAPPQTIQPIALLRAETLAIEDVLRRKGLIEQDERQIIADIAMVRGLTPDYIQANYLITPQGLIPQQPKAKEPEPQPHTDTPQETAQPPAVN